MSVPRPSSLAGVVTAPLGLARRALRPGRWPARPPFWPFRWPPRQPDRPVLQPDHVRDRVRIQVRAIREAFGDDLAVHSATGDDGDAEFFHHSRWILVREDRLDDVVSAIKRSENHEGAGSVVKEPEDRPLVPGLVRYLVPPRADTGRVDVLATLDDIERRHPNEGRSKGLPGIATPDHLLHVMPNTSGHGHVCPATEPQVPRSTGPVPALNPDGGVGKGIRVSVVDTGWYRPAADNALTPWFGGVSTQSDPEDIKDLDDLHLYAGHGTFVTGIIACLAPGAEIEVEGFLQQGGGVWESEITRQLNEAVADPDYPRLISISAGGRTRLALGMLAFVLLSQTKTWRGDPPLVVAAAGNDGSDWKLYPAAFDWVVSVGSLDADGTVSEFSNYGSWVDVYARGADLVNAFPTGTYTTHYDHPGSVRDFTGLASWSGTSFATPWVSGMIAARMDPQKPDARKTWNDILAGSHLTAVDQRGMTVKAV